MPDYHFSITPKEFLNNNNLPYKINGQWLGFKLCPFCGGGESGRDQWTFAVHSVDGNYNCLRDKCEAKGTFWGLIEFFGDNPKQYIIREGNNRVKNQKKRFVYGRR